jgi:putative FmdB family regulatory protein
MPRYEWKCRTCGFVKDTMLQAAGPCPQCGRQMKRVYSFMVPGPNAMPDRAHFNYSVGQYVTNQRDFEDKLKRKGEEMSNRLGIEHNYVAHEKGDRIGVTDE